LQENKALNILVIQHGKLGDMILTFPLFTELKRLFPDCKLYVLASDFNRILPENNPLINRVFSYSRNPFRIISLFAQLKSNFFDYYIDTKDHYSRTAGKLKNICRFNKSFGFSNDFYSFDINLKEYVAGKHAVDINLSPVNYFENDIKSRRLLPTVNIPDGVHGKFDVYFKDSNKINVLVNISAGNKIRHWENEKWIELINEISGKADVLLTGYERDKEDLKYIKERASKNNVRLISGRGIPELAEIIRQCKLVISPDTSIIHLASGFNIPVIGLYNNVEWNLEKFAPLSDLSKVLISDDIQSITSIKTEDVINAYREILKKI